MSVLDSLYNGYNDELNKNDLTNKILSQNSIKRVHEENPAKKSFVINSTKVKAAQTSDPFSPQTFTAFEAACRSDGQDDIDIRPRLKDGTTGQLTLLDSGSQCSVVNPDPGDKIDHSIKLETVSGERIPCYGKKVITIKINRKPYPIEVVKAKVKETILG